VTTLGLQNTLECATDVVSVDFHPHDRSLISLLCGDGTLVEWNLSADTHSTYEVREVARSVDGKVAYSADGTRMICSWGGVDGIFVQSTEDRSQPLMITTVPAMQLQTFSFSSDGKHVDALFAPKGERAVVKRWNIDTGDEVKSLRIAWDVIYCAVFSKNRAVLITGHVTKILVWTLDGDSSTLSTRIDSSWGPTFAIDVTRSGDIVASAGDDNLIRLFDASSGAALAVYHGHANTIGSLVFSRQEDCLVSTSSSDDTVRVWDTRKEAWSLDSSSSGHRLENIVFSPNGKFIAAISRVHILVWDGRDGSVLCKLTGHTGHVRSLVFSPDCTLLASFSPEDGVFLWSVGTKRPLPRRLSNSSTNDSRRFFIVFSATGTQLAVVNPTIIGGPVRDSIQVRIWDVSKSKGADSAEPGNEIFRSKGSDWGFPHFIRFSSNESLMLVRRLGAYYDGKVIVWDRVTNAVEEHDYDQDTHSSLNPAFHYDQGWIVSVNTGRRLIWLPERRRPYNGISYATHGNLIVIDSEPGVLSLLNLSPFECI
jgi:WD40 repeat protein